MPGLPLPPLTDGTPLDTGELTVDDRADVAAVWAPEIQQPTTAPVRDAIQDGQTAALLEYQRRRRYAAAQSDPLRASGAYADEIGSYEHGVHRQPGELDAAYRARYNAYPSVVDPLDVVAAANAVLAPYTATPCFYAESIDGWFLNDGGAAWSSHVFDGLLGGEHEVPNYPDRLYPDATPGGLTSLPARRPPGCMPADPGGRWFLLRAPDISALDSTVGAFYDDAGSSDGEGRFFADGTGSDFTCFYDFNSTATGVYNALIGAVNAIVGQSIRWSLYVDPNLTP